MTAYPVIFDVETKRSFREVGNNTKKLGVSVVAAYDYQTNKVFAFFESELAKLFRLFEKASVIIGYNSNSFDLLVLNEYYAGNLFKLPHFDILENIKELTGRRYALEDLVQATLGKGKSGHGLQAIELFREGRIDELVKYCQDDVILTKELFDFGLEKGYVFAPRVTDKYKITVNWAAVLKNQNKNSHNLTLGF